jgi:protoporphyrinogen oxidase
MQQVTLSKRGSMANVVILGAGLTGLSAAYHLEKRGYFEYTLFEKEPIPGGLCRSVVQDGFTFDFTGHLLHTSDEYFKQFIMDLVGLQALNAIHRRSFIYSHNTFTRYPFQMNLHGLPVDVITECIEGYVTRAKNKKNPANFVQWVQQNFGPGFAKYFFLPFQRKIFAYDLRDITASWTGRFVPSTTLKDMIAGAIADKEESIGYNAHFYYPKTGGIQSWIDVLAGSLKNRIYTNFSVQSIDLKRKVVTFDNGHRQTYDHLINTIPLDTFISLLHEPPTTHFAPALRNLTCNSVVNFNLGIARQSLSDKHWIYFPEKQFPFYRLGFPHNFSNTMAPTGCSSLYGEFSYVHRSRSAIKTMLADSLRSVKKLFSIAESEIVTEKVIPISHAYVIYNTWRERNLPALLAQLQEHAIFSTGRYGAWKYSSMQEAVLDGKAVAESITIVPAKKAYYESIQSDSAKQPELQ